METEVLVARGAPECGLPPHVGDVSVGDGRVFLQVLVVLCATNHAEVVASGGRGTFGVVLSHPLQTKEVGLLGPGFAAVDCCVVEFIYEHVEGAKVVASTGVGSVGIHDNVGVVCGPDEKPHEDPAWPAVVASCLVKACDLGPYSRKVLRSYAYRNSLLNPWLVFHKCSNSSSGAKTGATLRI